MRKIKHIYYINKSNYYKNGFHHSDLVPSCFVTNPENNTVFLPVEIIVDAPPATIKLNELSARKMLEDYAENLTEYDDMEDAAKSTLIRFGLIEDDYEPTPWCHGCGSMTQAKCYCGELAGNE